MGIEIVNENFLGRCDLRSCSESSGSFPSLEACRDGLEEGGWYLTDDDKTAVCPKHRKKSASVRAVPKSEAVNHPAHYTFGKLEVIDVIEDWRLGFHEGNVVKYVARAEHKGKQLEDLKKALWYLNRRIEQLEGAAEKP